MTSAAALRFLLTMELHAVDGAQSGSVQSLIRSGCLPVRSSSVDILPRYSSMPDPLLEPLSGHHLYRKIRSLHECVATPRGSGAPTRLSP